MTKSSEQKEFVSYVVELMQGIGPVTAKRMFGGHGIFLDGLMFGIIDNNILYLKADKETENDFKKKGLAVFTYMKKGKEMKLSYYQAPEETLEEPEKMNFWANKAYHTALQAKALKQKK